MWPSVAYVVEDSKLGTAYGLMTMVQNIGLFGFNLLVGALNDQAGRERGQPGRLPPGDGLGVLEPRASWRWSSRTCCGAASAGPHAHGLETITAKG